MNIICTVLVCVSDSVIPWTIARHVPLSMEFSRQEYWSGLSFPSPEDLLFLTQGLNLGLLNCRQILNPLSHRRSPSKVASVALKAPLLPLGVGGRQNHSNSQASHILKGVI